MIGNSLTNITEIIAQELEISEELLKEEKFGKLSIFGNRIMENCLFSNDFRYFLYGYYIKEIGVIYQKIFSSLEPRAFQSSKVNGIDFIKDLQGNIFQNLDEEYLWERFHIFNVKIQDSLKDKYEREHYKENINFTELVSKNLVKFLSENSEVLYLKYSQFIRGILNVLERIFRDHSGQIKTTLLIAYLKSLDRLYDYLLLKYSNEDNNDIEILNKEMEKYIKFICSEITKEKIDIPEYNIILWEIIKRWRIFYIYYLNVAPPMFNQMPRNKKVELPEETKKIIEDSLKEAIGKKL